MSTPREPRLQQRPAAPDDPPPIRLEQPPRGSVPELGVVMPPWDLPGMGVMFGRLVASIMAGVVLALVLEWWMDDPGPWPIIAIAVSTALGVGWAFGGAAPEIRPTGEEGEREVEGLLRSRGRR